MKNNMKRRKHALRKAVTAAVLAGTAFSSFGGALGTVTSVKAEEPSSIIKNQEEYDKLLNLIAEKKLRDEHLSDSVKTYDQIISELEKVLSEISVETLKTLVSGFDDGVVTYPYSVLESLSHQLAAFSPRRNDFKHSALSLKSLIVQEIYRRIENEKKVSKDLIQKTSELEQIKGKEKDISIEKDKVEAELKEKLYELENKNKDLENAKNRLEAYAESTESLSNQILDQDKENTELKEQLEKTKAESEAKVKELEKQTEEASLEFDRVKEEYDKLLSEEESRNKELSEKLKMAEEMFDQAQLKLAEERKALKETEAKLAEAEKANKELTDKVGTLTEERDAAKVEAEKVPELEAKVAELTKELEEAKVEAEELKAKSEELAKELEEVKAEKEALQAEIDKLKEEHKKEVDALNALLAEKDDIIKRLEEQVAKAKEEAEKNAQMSDEEKAKLQKELDQAKKELADMINKMPNKVEPHTGGGSQAGQANPSANQNAEHLPSTGEKAVNPLLVATGLSLIIGAGAYTYAAKRKKN